MFDPTFDPYGLLMELLSRTEALEKTNANLIRAINSNSQMLNQLSASHLALSKQHQELVQYVTTREVIQSKR